MKENLNCEPKRGRNIRTTVHIDKAIGILLKLGKQQKMQKMRNLLGVLKSKRSKWTCYGVSVKFFS